MSNITDLSAKHLEVLKSRIEANRAGFKYGPSVGLYWTSPKPFELTASVARSCYKNKPVYPEDLDNPASGEKREGRFGWDALVPSLYDSGHKTPLGHATAHLVIKASRSAIWSFLHNYIFYASSNQQSQRYTKMFKAADESSSQVELKADIIDLNEAILPAFNNPVSEQIYRDSFTKSFKAYKQLAEIIKQDAKAEFYTRFKRLEGTQDGERGLDRRALEIARYVLPIGTMANLWYTISLLSAHRLNRYPDYNTTKESQIIADSILAEWATKAPENLAILAKKPTVFPYESTAEGRLARTSPDLERNKAFTLEFDGILNGLSSKLISSTTNLEAVLGTSIRSVLGKTRAEMLDEQAVDYALNPATNPSLIHPIDDKLRSPISMCLYNAVLTFQKKMSHAGDSQNQRHRTIPGGRPLLSMQYTNNEQDCVIPSLISGNEQAAQIYYKSIRESFDAINTLMTGGESWENAQYLLPNAFPIRFVESAPLLFLHSKLRERLCWNAQEEIWAVSREELEQIKKVHPSIGKWIGAPCQIVDFGKKGTAMEGTSLPLSIGSCPEATDRFCGVRAWEIPIEKWKREI